MRFCYIKSNCSRDFIIFCSECPCITVRDRSLIWIVLKGQALMLQLRQSKNRKTVLDNH